MTPKGRGCSSLFANSSPGQEKTSPHPLPGIPGGGEGGRTAPRCPLPLPPPPPPFYKRISVVFLFLSCFIFLFFYFFCTLHGGRGGGGGGAAGLPPTPSKQWKSGEKGWDRGVYHGEEGRGERGLEKGNKNGPRSGFPKYLVKNHPPLLPSTAGSFKPFLMFW